MKKKQKKKTQSAQRSITGENGRDGAANMQSKAEESQKAHGKYTYKSFMKLKKNKYINAYWRDNSR